MKYLCGCDDRPYYCVDFDVNGKQRPRQDHEGFLVCPEHGEREYGWRTDQDIALGKLLVMNKSTA